jgi:hypothetical protein
MIRFFPDHEAICMRHSTQLILKKLMHKASEEDRREMKNLVKQVEFDTSGPLSKKKTQPLRVLSHYSPSEEDTDSSSEGHTDSSYIPAYTAQLSVLRTHKGTTREHWMLCFAGSRKPSRNSMYQYSVVHGVPDAHASFETEVKGKRVTIYRWDVKSKLHGQLDTDSKSTIDELKEKTDSELVEIGEATFEDAAAYIVFLDNVGSEAYKPLKKQAKHRGGNCLDFVFAVLKRMKHADPSQIDRTVVKNFKENIMDLVYNQVKEGTWDKIKKADGWSDGIRHRLRGRERRRERR